MTVTLDDRDRAVLDRLRDGAVGVASLADGSSWSPEALGHRLAALAEVGLVERADDGYALTGAGRRALAASPSGAGDDWIDTPPEVERRIDAFDLRADRAAAVRRAYTFLRYWGDATRGEIVDAVYSETPAGYDSAVAWWSDCVCDRLGALPGVDPPADGRWRSEAGGGRTDGRVAPDDAVALRGSARSAVAALDLADCERLAVRRAFDRLLEAGEASAADLREAASAGGTAQRWDDRLRPALESLPGVEAGDGDRLRYRPRGRFPPGER